MSFGPNREGALVGGPLLATDVDVQLAPNLSSADKDLALRVRQRSADGPWWALAPQQLFLHDRAVGATPLPPVGTLQPILVDTLGDPVMAAWVPDDDSERWYIVPDGVDWQTITAWLVEQALPAYVPNALRRARSSLAATDPKLETDDEARARQAMEDLGPSYTVEKARLEAAAQAARAAADPVRDGSALRHRCGSGAGRLPGHEAGRSCVGSSYTRHACRQVRVVRDRPV
ncbi:hypothetical protein ABZ746_35935 [Streptomyces sp. NPDC020096]